MNVHQSEELLVQVLLQLVVILPVARLAGNIARDIGQPRAVGEIVAGLMLGPSLFGWFMPDLSAALFTSEAAAPMQTLSQIGLLLLMFQIGCDFEFSHLAAPRNRRATICIAGVSVVAPLLTGYLLGWLTAPHLAAGMDATVYSLFVSVAFAITALPILGRILREYGLTRHELGVVAITAAAANDVCGWVLLATVAAIATAGFSASALAWQVGGIALLAALLFILGARVVSALLRRHPIVDGQIPLTVMAFVLMLIFACGIATQKLGIFTIFGGFLAGIVFHRHAAFVEAWQSQIGRFVLVFFLPIFFTFTGLRTNILGLTTVEDWTWCAVLVAGAIFAKILPVYFAARIGGFSAPESSILGVLMNTRALMELIVLNVGYSLGFIPQTVFTMLVLMAVLTTIMTGPLLRMLLPRAGLSAVRVLDA